MRRRERRAVLLLAVGAGVVGGVSLLFFVPKFLSVVHPPEQPELVDASAAPVRSEQAMASAWFERGGRAPSQLANSVLRDDFRGAREEYLARPWELLGQATRSSESAARSLQGVNAPQDFATSITRAGAPGSGSYGPSFTPTLVSNPSSSSRGALGYAAIPAAALTGLWAAGQGDRVSPALRALSQEGRATAPALAGSGGGRAGGSAGASSAGSRIATAAARYYEPEGGFAQPHSNGDQTPGGHYRGEGASLVTGFHDVVDPVVFSDASLVGHSNAAIVFAKVLDEPLIENLQAAAFVSSPATFSYSSFQWAGETSAQGNVVGLQLQGNEPAVDVILNPEPGSVSLLAVGLLAIAGGMRLSRRRAVTG